MTVPFSEVFGDVYFSVDDGLEETRHVFLQGNGLPAAWAGRKRFTICETGFGTGLNFLAAWSLFEETARPDAVLDYIAVELYPMTGDAIMNALSRWGAAFGGRLERLVKAWPMRLPGYHRIHFGRVRLTLIFDDVNAALPGVATPRGVDAWFLDGFAPAKNPQMWNASLYSEMARLSAPGARAATFTAAGEVRRGLNAAGFAVEKVKGYGRKRDMTVARWRGEASGEDPTPPRTAAIIGGGLAGTACAFALWRRGIKAVIFERRDTLASAASGNPVGLCNPRFSAQRHPQSDFFTASYALLQRTIAGLAKVKTNPCGSLHLMTSVEREKKFTAMRQNWGWPVDHLVHADADTASDLAGTAIGAPCLYLPGSMGIDPGGLCRAYAGESEIRLSHAVDASDIANMRDTFDAVILAQGAALAQADHGPMHTVRGQVTMVKALENAPVLRSNLCYGGYVSAPVGGVQMAGSTFQKWLNHTSVDEADNLANLAKMEAAVPSLRGRYGIIGARAALRTVSRDHMPMCGPVPGQDHVYMTAAHGSHGILSSLSCAELLADIIDGSPCSMSRDTMAALNAGRFDVSSNSLSVS